MLSWMRRFIAAHAARGLLSTALLAATLAWAAPSAEAAPPRPQVRGPYCTPAGCAGAPRSPVSAVAGLAGATLAAGLVARRGAQPTR